MNLSVIDCMNIATSLLLASAIWRQVEIILDTDWKHPEWKIDKYKILFPIFNFLLLGFMWLPYLNAVVWSAFCLLCGASIVFYTYWSPIFKIKKKK